MSSSTTRRRRPIHVHGAELSTDQDTIGTYAEAIAMLVALVALLAAAWVVAEPRPESLFTAPAARPEPAPAVYDVARTPDSTADVYWADAFDAPEATAVTIVPQDAAADDGDGAAEPTVAALAPSSLG